MCPVCTVAVVGGLGLSRFLGIDDTISGIWIGALMLSLSFVTTDWVQKKGWLKQIGYKMIFLITLVLLYLLTFAPMYWTNFIGHPTNKILGIDKIVLGSLVGSIFFLLGIFADKKARKLYGRQFFQYQKVIFPVAALILASVILYLAIK